MKLKSFIFLCVIFAWLGHDGARGQQSQPVSTPQPTCILQFALPVTGQTVAPFNSAAFDNRAAGCTSFALTVEVPTSVSALSLVVQTAPDNGSGIAGTWSTFSAATGSNPNTLTSGWTATFSTGTSAYFGWLRVQLTSRTGTGQVTGKLYSSIAVGGAASGSCPNPCPVVGTAAAGTPPSGNPVQVAGYDGSNVQVLKTNLGGALMASAAATTLADGVSNAPSIPKGLDNTASTVNIFNQIFPYLFNGATWDRTFACKNQALFNLSSSGNTQIIPASGSTITRICSLSFASSTTMDLKITQGTGVNCGTATADVTGLYKNILTADFEWGPAQPVTSGAGNAVCLNQSAANTTGGIVIYAQF